MNDKATHEEIDLQPTRLPDGVLVAGFFLLLAIVLTHLLILTPYTNNLDDIKYATLWVGGSVCLLAFSLLWLVRRLRVPPRYVTIPYLAYVALLVPSTLLAADYARWVGWQSLGMHVCLAGFFFLGAATVCTVRLVRWSVRFWVIVGLITCLFGIVHYVGGLEGIAAGMEARYRSSAVPGQERSGLHMLMLTFSRQRQMLSTILNTQFFGNFLSLILPIALAGIVVNFEDARDRIARSMPAGGSLLWAGLSVLVSLLSLVCMFLTFSKSVWGATALGVLLFVVLLLVVSHYSLFRLPAWPVALGLAAATLVTVFLLSFSDLKVQMSDVGHSLSSRSIIWSGAAEIFRDNPVLGAGPGSFRVEFPQYRSPDYHLSTISNLTLYAHNIVLDVLAETGLLGLLAYGGFLVGLFVLMGRAIRRCPSEILRVVLVGYAVGIACLYAGNLFTPMMRWPIGAVTTHAALGMAAGVAVTMLRGNIGRRPRAHFVWNVRTTLGVSGAIASAVLVCTAVYASKRFYTASYHNNQGIFATDQSERLEGQTDPQLVARQRQLLELSVREFEQALELNPTFVTSYYKLGFSYNRLGHVVGRPALPVIRKLRRTGTLSPAEAQMARQALEESIDMHLKARAAYDKLREYAPDYSEVHLNAAIIALTVAGNLRDVADLPIVDEQEKQQLRAQADESYRYSVEMIDRAAALSNKINVHSLAARIHYLYAQTLPAGSPERRQLLLASVERYERTRELPFSQFIQESGQLERERDERRSAAIMAAEVAMQAEEWERAARNYEYLAARGTGRVDYTEVAALNWRRAEMPGEALRVIEEGLARNPLNADLLLLRAETLMQSSRESEPARAAQAVHYLLALQERVPDLFDEAHSRRITQLDAQLHADDRTS